MNLATGITTSGNSFNEMNEELCVAGIEWLYGGENEDLILIRLPDESFVCINEDKESIQVINEDKFYSLASN